MCYGASSREEVFRSHEQAVIRLRAGAAGISSTLPLLGSPRGSASLPSYLRSSVRKQFFHDLEVHGSTGRGRGEVRGRLLGITAIGGAAAASCPTGRTSRSATRSGSLRRSVSSWLFSSQSDRSFFAAEFRWGTRHPHTISPGRSRSETIRTRRRDCSYVSDMRTSGDGLGSLSSRSKRSAS